MALAERHSDLVLNRETLARICAHYGVRRLEVFGSAAKGELREGSDVDLLVQFARRDDMGPADQYFGLKEALEELFGRPVDLLTEGAVRNRYLRMAIEQERKLLYAA